MIICYPLWSLRVYNSGLGGGGFLHTDSCNLLEWHFSNCKLGSEFQSFQRLKSLKTTTAQVIWLPKAISGQEQWHWGREKPVSIWIGHCLIRLLSLTNHWELKKWNSQSTSGLALRNTVIADQLPPKKICLNFTSCNHPSGYVLVCISSLSARMKPA